MPSGEQRRQRLEWTSDCWPANLIKREDPAVPQHCMPAGGLMHHLIRPDQSRW